MPFPLFVFASKNVWVCKLKKNIFEIGTKTLSKQPFYVFKDERVRPRLADRANSLWKHITTVIIGHMSSAQREWLTWRPAGNSSYAPSVFRKTNFFDIRMEDIPVPNLLLTLVVIFFQCSNGILVKFNKHFVFEATLGHAKG